MRENEGKLGIHVIKRAVKGSSEAIEQTLAHYDGYIVKLSTVACRNEEGVYYLCVDEDMKVQLQETLAHAIRCFDLEGILQNGRYSKRKSAAKSNQNGSEKSDDTDKLV